jgi:hypothetical protein
MKSLKQFSVLLGLTALAFCACKKSDDPTPSYPPREVTYVVKGTKFTLNFIDSSNAFEKGVIKQDSFRYDFWKGPGTNIGITVASFSPSDTVYSWEIYIDGKLSANALGQGGAYFGVPYPTN